MSNLFFREKKSFNSIYSKQLILSHLRQLLGLKHILHFYIMKTCSCNEISLSLKYKPHFTQLDDIDVVQPSKFDLLFIFISKCFQIKDTSSVEPPGVVFGIVEQNSHCVLVVMTLGRFYNIGSNMSYTDCLE